MAQPSQPDPRPEEDTVRYEIVNGVAWVWFNRPDKRNCMSPKLNRQMKKVLDELEFRDDVAVLVLTGEGSVWSAGMDLLEYFRMNKVAGIRARVTAYPPFFLKADLRLSAKIGRSRRRAAMSKTGRETSISERPRAFVRMITLFM